MFVTLRIILKNIIKGVILSFLSFFFLLIGFSNPVYGNEVSREKAEFNYFPAKKKAASIFSLKKIHPQGTRDSAEGIRTNYRWARVKKQTERLFPRHLI